MFVLDAFKVVFFFFFWTHLTLESNKAPARSHLSPSRQGGTGGPELRHPATRLQSDETSNNWSSSIEPAVVDCVLNCLKKRASDALMSTVNIWISV